MTLNEIGVEENTDKAALLHRGSHHYLDLYELLFRGWRDDDISILEIGVLDGGSARTWLRYFPNAKITVLDILDVAVSDPRVEFIHGDAYSDEVISKLQDRTYDIMIDDADHRVENQTIFLKRYSPMLKPNGIMIVEDVIVKGGAQELKAELPHGFSCAIVEMNEGNSILNSRLLIAYRT